ADDSRYRNLVKTRSDVPNRSVRAGYPFDDHLIDRELETIGCSISVEHFDVDAARARRVDLTLKLLLALREVTLEFADPSIGLFLGKVLHFEQRSLHQLEQSCGQVRIGRRPEPPSEGDPFGAEPFATAFDREHGGDVSHPCRREAEESIEER